MSKNKYGAFNVGQEVIFKGEHCTILSKQKGGKTTTPNTQGGIFTAYKSRPCTYTLSNGITVRGDKLTKIKGGENEQ